MGNPQTIGSYQFNFKDGHYTQIVWADMHNIGCGYSQFKDGQYNTGLYVCNYGPAGNILTYPVYTTGEPCSECPDGTRCSSQYAGLCASSSTGGPQKRPEGGQNLFPQSSNHQNLFSQSSNQNNQFSHQQSQNRPSSNKNIFGQLIPGDLFNNLFG